MKRVDTIQARSKTSASSTEASINAISQARDWLLTMCQLLGIEIEGVRFEEVYSPKVLNEDGLFVVCLSYKANSDLFASRIFKTFFIRDGHLEELQDGLAHDVLAKKEKRSEDNDEKSQDNSFGSFKDFGLTPPFTPTCSDSF